MQSPWVTSVAFSPDGKTLASGSEKDNDIKLWRVADGSLITTLSGHSDWVRSVAFSPDGKTLGSGSHDKSIKLWRVADGSLITTLSEHSGSVMSVAFSPDGKTLASGSADKSIKLWDFFEINSEINSKEMARQSDLIKKEAAWQTELNNKNPQMMYLRAGQYARDGESSRAVQLYESIIKRFPDSPFAVKADDQLNAGRRAERMENEKRGDQRAASRQQCEAQKQTCFSGCGQSSYWNGRSYVDNQSWSGCRSRCESISCY
jgi:predicted NACHT family NTPase